MLTYHVISNLKIQAMSSIIPMRQLKTELNWMTKNFVSLVWNYLNLFEYEQLEKVLDHTGLKSYLGLNLIV